MSTTRAGRKANSAAVSSFHKSLFTSIVRFLFGNEFKECMYPLVLPQLPVSLFWVSVMLLYFAGLRVVWWQFHQQEDYGSSAWFYSGKTVGSVQFSRSVVSNSLQPHELYHARPPCPSPTPGVHSDSCPSSQWWQQASDTDRISIWPQISFKSWCQYCLRAL